MRKEPDFLSQFKYAKLNETISSTKFYAFDDAFTHVTTLNEISLYILQSVSSGLKLLNTFAHCCANEISDLGKSAYLNYAKNSSCRLLCINASLIHHIIFSSVSMNLVRN